MASALYTIFGGTGYLGSAVVRRLATLGCRVRIAVRCPVAPDDLGAGVEQVRCDIRDPASVAKALAGAEGGVNAVSLYVEGQGQDSFQAVHVDAARCVARTARERGVSRLVHVSGIGSDPRSPSPYVAARGRGEAAVREAMPEAALLRPSVLFGPGDAFLGTLDGVTRLPVVPLFGDGSTRLQPVHVDDVAAAAAAALTRPEAAGRVFELGGAGVYRYRDLLEMVMAARRRRRLLLPVPFALWRALARACAILPSPPLTLDQVIIMQRDNTVSSGTAGFAELLGLFGHALAAKDVLVAGAQSRQLAVEILLDHLELLDGFADPGLDVG